MSNIEIVPQKNVVMLNNERSEEVQYIIERMPTRFGYIVSCLIGGLFFLLAAFSWFIQYPDVVTGEITINAIQPPVKLVAAAPGKLIVLVKSQEDVKPGQYLAYLDNTAKFADVIKLKHQLGIFNPDQFFERPNDTLQHHLILGDITVKYFTFIASAQSVFNFKTDSLFSKQRKKLVMSLDQENQRLTTYDQQLKYNRKQVELSNKALKRDSVLFHNKMEAEAEYDKAKANNLGFLQGFNNIKQEIILTRQRKDDVLSQLQQLAITANEKEISLKLALTSSYNDLLDNISAWDQRYAYIAPIRGKAQFLKFWSSGQFVQPSDEIFTIVPLQSKAIGQLILPSLGAGKVKVGQDVMIKLENYPFTEYGVIKGNVHSISLTTNVTRSKDQATNNNYLIEVNLEDGLKTNYGTQLDYKVELKGSADIITNKRRLYSRLFDHVNRLNDKN